MLHRFRVEPIKNNAVETYIDDKKVSCRGFDVRMRIDEIPTVSVDLVGLSDMDIIAEVNAYSSGAIGNTQLLNMIEERLDQIDFLIELKRLIEKWNNSKFLAEIQ